jgi:hypothetical protein
VQLRLLIKATLILLAVIVVGMILLRGKDGGNNARSGPPEVEAKVDFGLPLVTGRATLVCPLNIVFDVREGHGIRAAMDAHLTFFGHDEAIEKSGCEEWREGIPITLTEEGKAKAIETQSRQQCGMVDMVHFPEALVFSCDLKNLYVPPAAPQALSAPAAIESAPATDNLAANPVAVRDPFSAHIDLIKRSGVAVLLPSFINAKDDSGQPYNVIAVNSQNFPIEVSPTDYSVSLAAGDAPYCNDMACYEGEITASATATLTKDSLGKLDKVQLSNGIEGYYLESEPGSRERNQIYFYFNRVEYCIELYLSKEGLTKLANSAIEAGPR